MDFSNVLLAFQNGIFWCGNLALHVRFRNGFKPLTLSWRGPSSYRNHLLCKSMDWFLYDNGPRHEGVKRQPNKMVKHTQTVLRQQLTNCLSVFDHFMGVALKGLISLMESNWSSHMQCIYVSGCFLCSMSIGTYWKLHLRQN